ncbi:hypothetical protein BFP97_07070 [Roseivirga sp. 4D4]|uniref:hypothetical protein n=1 Tax=Roseivirga sp. 4D4 TaxID=1889784 RepID=UPI0008539AF0|nr:hypothetical protein [Roseivirga sp. 4D4]OEK01288.1 hypothetical protein BFP97_07070 [Roseivirga sp. 4D4]
MVKVLFALAAIFLFNNVIYAQTEVYSESNRGFTFRYFEGWTISNQNERIAVFAPKENRRDYQAENWGITSSFIGKRTLEECYQEYIIESFPNLFESFKIIDQGQSLLDGVKFKWIEYGFVQNGLEIKNLTYLAVHKEELFVLIGYSSKNRFDVKYGNLFRKMMESFKFIK